MSQNYGSVAYPILDREGAELAPAPKPQTYSNPSYAYPSYADPAMGTNYPQYPQPAAHHQTHVHMQPPQVARPAVNNNHSNFDWAKCLVDSCFNCIGIIISLFVIFIMLGILAALSLQKHSGPFDSDSDPFDSDPFDTD